MREMYLVQEEIKGAHPMHTTYPLLNGDLLSRDEEGTFTKECPGITVMGFVLTDEQQKTLKQVRVWTDGLYYQLAP